MMIDVFTVSLVCLAFNCREKLRCALQLVKWKLVVFAFFPCFVLSTCGPLPEEKAPTLRLRVVADTSMQKTTDVVPLNEAVQAKIGRIRRILARNSLSQLARLADTQPGFVSNFAGESNRTHWDLLRRSGFDPLAQLEALLDGPYDTQQVGQQLWYIWPDLAALRPDALLPEKLDFSDRARLRALVGEQGIGRIRAGQSYPGVRTAIAEDGRWLYFIHEGEDDPERSEQ